MPRQRSIEIHDRYLDGAVTTYIADAVARNVSYEQIAKGLVSEFEIDVTANTVRTWVLDSRAVR